MIMRKSHITMAIGNEMCFDTYKFICYLWNLAYYYEKMSYYNGIGNEMCFDTYKYKSIMDNRTPSLTCCELTYKFFCLWSAFIVFPLPRSKIYSQVIFLCSGWLVRIPIFKLPRSAIRPLPHSILVIVISTNPWPCSLLEEWHNELVSFLIWNRCEVSVLSCFLTCAPCFSPFLLSIFE